MHANINLLNIHVSLFLAASSQALVPAKHLFKVLFQKNWPNMCPAAKASFLVDCNDFNLKHSYNCNSSLWLNTFLLIFWLLNWVALINFMYWLATSFVNFLCNHVFGKLSKLYFFERVLKITKLRKVDNLDGFAYLL